MDEWDNREQKKNKTDEKNIVVLIINNCTLQVHVPRLPRVHEQMKIYYLRTYTN